jgi:hypothetical protein
VNIILLYIGSRCHFAPQKRDTKASLAKLQEQLVIDLYIDRRKVLEEVSKRQKMGSEESASFKESFDAKMNTVHQIIDNLKTELKAELKSLDEKMTKHAKMQTLAWAITNCGINTFGYYDERVMFRPSEKLVRNILLGFRKGVGYTLPDGARLRDDCRASGEQRKGRMSKTSATKYRTRFTN